MEIVRKFATKNEPAWSGVPRVFIIALFLLGSLTPSLATLLQPISAYAVSGTGSAADPYEISNCAELQNMSTDLAAHYVLVNDIDCSTTPSWNDGQGFAPIGNDTTPFTGTLEGNGNTIIGLTEFRADDDSSTNHDSDPSVNQQYIGLIGKSHDATVTDLHLVKTMVKGYKYVGGIIGYMDGGTIIGSSVNLTTANGDDSCSDNHCIWARYGLYGGGLVGYMNGGSIERSYTGGPVKGSGSYIGGLVGSANNGAQIRNSSTTSQTDGGVRVGGAAGELVNSTMYAVSASAPVAATLEVTSDNGKPGDIAGGLIGFAYQSTVEHSYATGSVTASNYYAGGLVGLSDGSTFTDVFSTGSVVAQASFGGGLIGNSGSDTILRAYSSGAVSSTENGFFGGFTAYASGSTITDSFSASSIANTSGATTGGFIGYAQGSVTLSHDYFDLTKSGQTACVGTDMSTSGADCTGINSNGSQSTYFTDRSNAPFMSSGTAVWPTGTWYFDGAHLPVFTPAPSSTEPNNGDTNDDGINDALQPNVTSIANPISGHTSTVAVNGACSLSDVNAVNQNSLNSDGEYKYPLGLINFKAMCGTPGFTSSVTQYYYNPPAANFVLRKYSNGQYQTISEAVIEHMTINGQPALKVTYRVTDGGTLDADGTANGTIVDPVGLATTDAIAVPGAPNTGLQSDNVRQFMAITIGAVLLVAGAVLVRRPKKYVRISR